MSKPLSAGGEVDAYCTKCRMDLNHRIVAMEGARIARVECLTCRTQHNYRRPQSAISPLAKDKVTRARREASEAAPQSRSRAGGPRKQWEQAIAGKAPGDFTAYNIAASFALGQLVRHKKFGDGVVSQVIDANKVEVLFEDGAKLLAQGKR
jgi:hypothetical protein